VAELALKVDPGGDDDGDCTCAFNDRMIAWKHMQKICHHRHSTRSHGLILPGSLTQKMLERVSEFRFERIGKNEAQRVILATMDVERLSGMAVVQFITRARRSKNRIIFGEYGREVWYGGNTDTSMAAVDDVWAEIESHEPPEPPPFVPVDDSDEPPVEEEYVPYLRKDHTQWPMGVEQPPSQITLTVPPHVARRLERMGRPRPFEVKYFGADRQNRIGIEGDRVSTILGGQEGRNNLFIRVDDFDDAEASRLVAPEMRDTGEVDKNGEPIMEMMKKRQCKVDWRNLLSADSIAVVDDKRQYVDKRAKSSFVRRDIVVTKPLSISVG